MEIESVKRLCGDILDLDKESQLRLFSLWVDGIRGNRDLRNRICAEALRACYPSKTNKIEDWMEKRLLRDMGLKPRHLAFEYRYYARMNRNMQPYLAKLARRVKNKLTMRFLRDKSPGKTSPSPGE